MFCINCIGTGIITGLGEYRGVCPDCDGLGKQKTLNHREEAKLMIKSQCRDTDINIVKTEK